MEGLELFGMVAALWVGWIVIKHLYPTTKEKRG